MILARGLDIPSIHTVVNYEVARDIDTHTHRVGRTGRAGVKGTAYTLFVAGRDPADFAAHLVRHLELAGQAVPPRLLEIARQCIWFAENRAKAAAARAEHPRPGIGFQPRERPSPLRTSDSASTGSTPSNSTSDPHFSSWQPGCGPATVAASSGRSIPFLKSLKSVGFETKSLFVLVDTFPFLLHHLKFLEHEIYFKMHRKSVGYSTLLERQYFHAMFLVLLS